MKTYKYQMHTHTAPCSKCATMTPVELIDSLIAGGYSGCVLTNHFLKGNSGIDRNLPWNEFVACYEKDYVECKKAAEGYDLDIIFGIEEQLIDGLEILCYGITPQFLYDNPQLTTHSLETWSTALHNFGALCIQAHPFRERGYIPNPRLLPTEYIDGIEVFNFSNNPKENKLAADTTSKYPDWILVSGADAHSGGLVCCAGIEAETRITNEKALVDVLKSGKYKLIK